MPKKSRREKCRIVDGDIEHRGWKKEACSWCYGTGVERKYPSNCHMPLYSDSGKDKVCGQCEGSREQERCQCGGETIACDNRPFTGWNCAIATATLGSGAECELNTLRAYRDRMTQYRLGRLFRGWYERVKKPVAAHLRDRQRHKQVVLRLFIQPMLALLSKRETSSVPRLMDLVGMSIYSAMLLWASLLYLLVARRKQHPA